MVKLLLFCICLVSAAPEFWGATSDQLSLFPVPLVKLNKEFVVFIDGGNLTRKAFLSRQEECQNTDVKVKIIRAEYHYISVVATEVVGDIGNDRQTLFFCTKPLPEFVYHRTVLFEPKEGVNFLFIFFYLIVVCLSCLFTGLNLALLSLDVDTLEMVKNYDEDPKMREYAEEILQIRSDPNLMICTIIYGNTLCNVVGTLIFSHLTNDIELSGWKRNCLINVVPTIIMLLFCEILPQIVCTKYAICIGARLQSVMRFFTIVMFPVAKSTALALDIVVGKEGSKSIALREIARLAQRKEKMAMIVHNVLKLRKRTAKDVMTPMDRVKKISDREPVNAQLRDSLKMSHTRMPVYKAGDPSLVYGVFNVKDLLLIEDSPYITVGTVMQMWPRTSTCRFVPADMPVTELMIELKSCSTLACVMEFEQVGPEKKMVTTGIVTLEDMMEEIIGEIYDEKDLRRNNTAAEAEKEEPKQNPAKSKKPLTPKVKEDAGQDTTTAKAPKSKAMRSKKTRGEEA